MSQAAPASATTKPARRMIARRRKKRDFGSASLKFITVLQQSPPAHFSRYRKSALQTAHVPHQIVHLSLSELFIKGRHLSFAVVDNIEYSFIRNVVLPRCVG